MLRAWSVWQKVRTRGGKTQLCLCMWASSFPKWAWSFPTFQRCHKDWIPVVGEILKSWHDGNHMSAMSQTEVLRPCLTVRSIFSLLRYFKNCCWKKQHPSKELLFSQVTCKTLKGYHSWNVTACFWLFLFWFRQRWPVEGGVICSMSSCAVHPVVSSLAFLNFLCPHQGPKLSWPWKELSLK